ncbi:hypothetical protein SLS54_004063 [Diplodia seriata]
MPPIRVAQHARPAPVEPHHAFVFPKDHHLVITTESNVWSWDRSGLTNAFGSASGGILAAKEAKDGSGLLAVADDQVVVLHDANRGMDRSYRLKGTDNLTLRTPALQLQPRASASAVETAAFHPDRPNVFLLAFKDGTLAAYDATRILGKAGRGGSSGEVGRFKGLHAVTNRVGANLRAEMGDDQQVTGDRSVSITSAAFLPGHRSRAVSVGADGRCRLLDFEYGGNILRTWHAKGPATSLSILTVRQKQAQLARAAISRAETAGAPTNTLAVGREDGKVLIFDSVGILLSEQTVDAEAGRVIDVQWMKGPGLRPHSKPAKARVQQDVVAAGDIWAASPSPADDAEEDVEDVLEDDSGTVYHRPAAESPEQRPQINAMNYLDLFSPVKQPPANSPQRRSPRPRPRPRILSSTFRQSSVSLQPPTSPRLNLIPQMPRPSIEEEVAIKRPSSPAQLFNNVFRRHQALEGKSPTKLPSPTKRSGSPLRAPPSEVRVAKTPSSKTPRARKGRRTSARMPVPLSSASSSRNVSTNSNILADIRRLGESGGKKIAGLALLAPYMNQRNTPRSALCVEQKTEEPGMEPEVAKPEAAKPEIAKPEIAKPKIASPADDIWLTSDDEAPTSHLRSRGHRLPSQRTQLQRLERITFVPAPDQHSRRYSGISSVADESDNNENAERIRRRSVSPEHKGSGSKAGALGDIDNSRASPWPRNGRKSGLGVSNLFEVLQHGEEQQDENGCECGKKCCAALRNDVQNLSEELRLLREEMAEMRFLMGR